MTRRRVLAFILAFFGLWILAWVIFRSLSGSNVGIAADTMAGLEYWLVAKTLVWGLFPYFFVNRSLGQTREFVGLGRGGLRRGLPTGAPVSLLWAALSLGIAWAAGRHFERPVIGASWLYIVLVTPFLEELMFRGFIHAGLRECKWSAWKTAIATSLLFVLIHCVGWTFQGKLAVNLFFAYPLSLLVFS